MQDDGSLHSHLQNMQNAENVNFMNDDAQDNDQEGAILRYDNHMYNTYFVISAPSQMKIGAYVSHDLVIHVA